jgi:hypothetical protein
MALSCNYPNCYPEDRECQAGNKPFEKCPHLRRGDDADENRSATPSNEELNGRRVSWTSSVLGQADLEPLAGRSRVLLLGLVGLENAGKTTFLALLYSLLRAGQAIPGYRFAGSYTLAGWELIAGYLTFDGSQNQVRFPPHTSRNAGRVPGMLHLALRDEAGRLRDVVFTDAPGGWFDEWRSHEQAVGAVGAEWIYAQGDGFLLFADSAELTSENRNTTRSAIEMVADRLVAKLGTRPLGLVWAKSDVENTRPVVREKLRAYLAAKQALHYEEFAVSVQLSEGNHWHQQVLETVAWLLKTIDTEPGKRQPAVPRAETDDLFLLRRSIGT